MLKVIFLDIDGVLNCDRTWVLRDRSIEYGNHFEYTHSSIDIYAVALVNKLAEETKAKIVVSSSHRIYFRNEFAELNRYMQYIGIKDNIYGVTPYLGTRRGHEIALWLKEHEEVTHYVILDDDSDMLVGQMKNFVQTDGQLGFQVPDFNKAMEILINDSFIIQRGEEPVPTE
jgi:hypothetical protein